MAQDSTLANRHSPELKEGIPTLYIGNGKPLQKSQLGVIVKSAQERGMDLSTSADGKVVKFFHFGEESELEAFGRAVLVISQAAGFLKPVSVHTQGDLHEAANYLSGQSGRDIQETGLLGSEAGRPALFGRLLDHALIPYAKAIGAEGYRFSPDLFAERFGLSDAERELIRESLKPKEGPLPALGSSGACHIAV